MSDLVNRLRGSDVTAPLQHEAANRIEELEAEVAKLTPLYGVLNAVRICTRSNAMQAVRELLPRMNEVLTKAEEHT